MALYYPGKTLYYNGYDLTSVPGFLVTEIDVHQIPRRTLEAYKLARADGQVLVSTYYDYRKIVVKAAFVCATQALFEQARDTVLKNTAAANGFLAMLVNGSYRQYTCTLSDDTAFSEYAGGYATAELHFNAFDPFGYDTGATLLANLTFGSSVQPFTFAAGGTAPVQTPLYSIKYNSFTGSTPTYPGTTLTNMTTGETCTYTGTAGLGDTLIFNAATGILTKNGTSVAYTGVIPRVSPDTTTVRYTDLCTVRNVTALFNNTRKYI